MRQPTKLTALLLLSSLLAACSSLPARTQEAPAPVIDTQDTMLARTARKLADAHADLSGIYPLEHGRDALIARLALAMTAEKTLDLQYYIWHNDVTGRLVTAKVVEAADRGVKVRVLLDDVGSKPDDETLLGLAGHPNIEVRLFNPVSQRWLRTLGMLLEFRRVNRRMHNKSFTADDHVTIVGGRNIGDEYFEANPEIDFSDLDVLAVGPVVAQVETSFDLYWRHERAIPIKAFYPRVDTQAKLAALRVTLAAQQRLDRATGYLQQLQKDALALQLRDATLPFYWGNAQALYDHPDKLTEQPTRTLIERLAPVATQTDRSLDIVSPYFVPGKGGTAWLVQRVAQGMRVRVLTNSLAATDVGMVHAGYAPYRKPLLKGGVQLYELKPDPAYPRRKGGSGWTGSSRASLHAKSFIFDRRHVFIGSLNLDPRSIELNTEIGILLDSPALADHMADQFDELVADETYRLSLDDGKLQWHDPDSEAVHDHDPETSLLRRLGVDLLRLLPIESQL
ncbi:MAG TPA: phospholipase D family protein [Chitinolyticbacter sp.]|nr:phospholipase D family protein [Chitinolyticbacter sp.]